jgi:chromate transporter
VTQGTRADHDGPLVPFSAARRDAPSLSELFVAFCRIALSGFGGVLPWARRVLVDDRAWMNAAEFNEALALCQFLPGPNIVNLSVVLGSRAQGLPGALAAFAGLIGPPVIIVLCLAAIYGRFGHDEWLRGALAGLAAAAAGLMIGTAAKMVRPLLSRRSWPLLLVAVAALVTVGILRWPLPPMLLGLVPVSLALAWWKAP